MAFPSQLSINSICSKIRIFSRLFIIINYTTIDDNIISNNANTITNNNTTNYL
jgi:hypothetical protein